MPIFSYLAIPVEGARAALSHELKALPHCQVIPADNEDILILVTDAPDENAERDLQEHLKNIPSLQSLSMAFGCSDELQPER
jgi:nitrate reductase NapAB chaperone NapD